MTVSKIASLRSQHLHLHASAGVTLDGWLKIFEDGQLFESGLLTEIKKIGVVSVYLDGINFRSFIRGEQFVHAQFGSAEGIQ